MTTRRVEIRFPATKIDKKWQDRWDEDGIYRTPDDDPRPKWHELTMYPYPSGDLHIGHWYTMAPSDCHARFRRMQGYNVLHPMGFDAFGLAGGKCGHKAGYSSEPMDHGQHREYAAATALNGSRI